MNVKKKIFAFFFAAGAICLSPLTVFAENESVTFGSESYESVVDGEFPVGIYLASDQVIVSYEFQVQYDPNRLAYKGAAETNEENGTISMSGNGNSTGSVRERLEFSVINGGEAFVQIVSATFTLEDGSEVAVPVLGKAPVYLEGEDTVPASMEVAALLQGIPDDSGQQGTEAQEAQEEEMQAESGEASEASALEEAPEKSSLLAETSGEDFPSIDEAGEIGEISAAGLKGILDSFGNFGAILIFEVLAILACLLLILATVLHRRKRKAKKRRKAVKQKQVSVNLQKVSGEPGSTLRDMDLSSEKALPAEERREEETVSAETMPEKQPVISVQHVTMDFHVSTSNVSGFKEYLIQRIRHQISYRDFRALDDISFDVFKGEVVGIIGTNGSGKSTLLRIVSGALRPTSGTVVVDRQKVQLLTLGTGFDLELTAKENVYLNGAIIGYSKEFLDAHYDEIVEFAELHDFMEEKVKNFSSGMVSRLGFSIATAGGAAEILILDEVLSVGDEFFRKKSLARIKEMIHGGSTVLMVSHGMATILENCTKVVWIEKGELCMLGEPKAVCAAYRTMS